MTLTSIIIQAARGTEMNNGYKLIEKMNAIQYRINLNDKKPKSFSTNQLLYQSEIHFIDAIGIAEEVNASQLSSKLGITNGAVTQVAQKLIKKKLIEKYKKETNKKEVYFKLTEMGRVAYENHKAFHKELEDKIFEYLKGLSQEQIEGLFGLVAITEEHLPRL
jgi:DNA-binding MarR family transcriptional regulator